MSDEVPVGGLAGDSVTCPNDGEVYFSVHGFDNVDGFDVPYDEIEYEDNNRWHLQVHFEEMPYGDGESFSYITDHVNFKLENPNGDYLQLFENWEPKEWQMNNEEHMEFPVAAVGSVFAVAAPIAPYIVSAMAAMIAIEMNGGGGNVTSDDYGFVDWTVPLYGSALAPEQDDAHGVWVDVFNQSDDYSYGQLLNASCEYTYLRVDGYGYDYFTTDTLFCDPYYYPIPPQN